MNTEIFRDTRNGFGVVGLHNDAVALAIVPELGARVISVRDRRCAREWIWSPESDAPLRRAQLGDSFEDSGHGGIDECIPTIGACIWRKRPLPDHGEAWSAAWALDDAALARGELRTTLRLPLSPLTLERTITLKDDTVHFAYQLTSHSPETEPFLWAWHPLFGLREGDQLELPAGAETMRLEVATGAHAARRGEVWPLPRPFPNVDITRLDLGPEFTACMKGFINPLPVGDATVRLRGTGGEALTVRWNTRENPLLGIWLSRGYLGMHHVALEPTNGAPDRLDLAVQDWRSHGQCPVGGRRKWSLILEVRYAVP